MLKYRQQFLRPPDAAEQLNIPDIKIRTPLPFMTAVKATELEDHAAGYY